MNAKRLKRDLRRIVGPKAILNDPAGLAAYSYDSSLQTAVPDLVVFPDTTEQVARIVRLLKREGVPYVARGAGTNLSGGSIPLRGGAVIALARMRKIHDIDPENFCARVGPGLTNLALQEALAEHGFFFAPDPASQKVSTLGGNVAENSGGPHCLKYGVTTNHVLGLTLVTPEGEIMRLGGETLDGPDAGLLGLIVGSEGTLGIATEIYCRIMPLPESVKTMLAIFDSTEQAGRSVSDIIAAGILPATLEMMDNMVIRAVEQSLSAGYPIDAAAVLIIEVDGTGGGLGETAAEIESICRGNAAREVRVARDEREREQLWAGRRGAFGAVARLFPNYMVSDGTVPRTKLPEVLARIAEIGRKYELEIGNVFHAGDGNLHPLVFFDARDAAQVERVHRAGEEILGACLEAGGTITGEHGVGLEKIRAMPRFFGAAEIQLMRDIKSVLDPSDLCNPGKVLPEAAPDRNDAARTGAQVSGVTSDAGAGDAGETQSRFRAKPVFSPADPAELAAVIRELAEGGKTFAPVGARTLFPFLPSVRTPDAFIETTRLGSIVEHNAANLTVTVQAGLTLGELRKNLAASGQFLPVDAPSRGTVGGAVACALAGPRRHTYGAVRDLVLGLRFVTADGRMLRAGGKTVKNVAGYDFGKLLVGSWGALGIITETTFRLVPLPRASGAVAARFARARDAYEATFKAVHSRLDPTVATLLGDDAASHFAGESKIDVPTGNNTLVLGAEGAAGSVERRLEEFERICEQHGAEVAHRIKSENYTALIDGINSLCLEADDPTPSLSVCICAPCKEAPGIFEKMRELAGEHGARLRSVAHLAGGSVYSRLFKKDAKDADGFAGEVVSTMGDMFQRSSITVFGVDGDGAQEIPFIVGNDSSQSWRRAIKKCFDPKGLLNPGMREW